MIVAAVSTEPARTLVPAGTLVLEGVGKSYQTARGPLDILVEVSLTAEPGESLW